MGVQLEAVRALSWLTRCPTRLVGEMTWVLRFRLPVPLSSLQLVDGACQAHLRGFPHSLGPEPLPDQFEARFLLFVEVRTIAAGLRLGAHGDLPLCCVIARYASPGTQSPLVQDADDSARVGRETATA